MKGYILTYETLAIAGQPVPVATAIQEIECQFVPSDPSITASTVYESKADALAAIDAHHADLQTDVTNIASRLNGASDTPTPSAPASSDAKQSDASAASAPSDDSASDDTGPPVDTDNDGKLDSGDMVVDPNGKRARVISITDDQVSVAYKSGKTATYPLADLKTAQSK